LSRTHLAIEGGVPVREGRLPYGRQSIDDRDVQAVIDAVESGWLTTGPRVAAFERALAERVGTAEAVVVNSGTAALHAMVVAAGVGPGDEVIVPPLTFAATANVVLYAGGTPVFADIDPRTLQLSPEAAESAISPRTRAIIAVDYAGEPADVIALRAMSERHGVELLEDACHALGATLNGQPIGSTSAMAAFSFHPVKHVTTGEGGAVTTDDAEHAERMRRFRNHGIMSTFEQRERDVDWHYEMVELGYNYRLPDILCALGLAQLGRLDTFLSRRRAIAARYMHELGDLSAVELPLVRDVQAHAWHIFPILLRLDRLRVDRGDVFRALTAEGIGVNVHYIPVHLHPYYRDRFGYQSGAYPAAESAYERLLTLPIFPGMTEEDVDDVLVAVGSVLDHYGA
jgi:perosamine synthetase